MAGRYKGPGLTKEEKIKSILAIRQGLIDPKDLKTNDHLHVTGMPEYGLSEKEIEGNGGYAFLFNKYKNEDGRIFKYQDLPPLVQPYFIFLASIDESGAKPVIDWIVFNATGIEQRIRYLLGTLNIEL